MHADSPVTLLLPYAMAGVVGQLVHVPVPVALYLPAAQGVQTTLAVVLHVVAEKPGEHVEHGVQAAASVVEAKLRPAVQDEQRVVLVVVQGDAINMPAGQVVQFVHGGKPVAE